MPNMYIYHRNCFKDEWHPKGQLYHLDKIYNVSTCGKRTHGANDPGVPGKRAEISRFNVSGHVFVENRYEPSKNGGRLVSEIKSLSGCSIDDIKGVVEPFFAREVPEIEEYYGIDDLCPSPVVLERERFVDEWHSRYSLSTLDRVLSCHDAKSIFSGVSAKFPYQGVVNETTAWDLDGSLVVNQFRLVPGTNGVFSSVVRSFDSKEVVALLEPFFKCSVGTIEVLYDIGGLIVPLKNSLKD